MFTQTINVSKNLITPFTKIDKKVLFFILLLEWFLFGLYWQMNAGDLVPKPIGIINQLVLVLSSDYFYLNLATSVLLIFKAMFFATIIALLVSYSYLMSIFKPVVKFLIVLRYLPLTGIIFVFGFMYPNGSDLKLMLLLFGIVPFFVTGMVSSIDAINPQLYDLCKTLRMNRWQTLVRVVIKGEFHYVFEVIRQNFAICWLMITMVEGLSMSEGGIGAILIKQNKSLNLDYIFAIQATLFLLGIGFDFMLKLLRNKLFKFVPLQQIK